MFLGRGKFFDFQNAPKQTSKNGRKFESTFLQNTRRDAIYSFCFLECGGRSAFLTARKEMIERSMGLVGGASRSEGILKSLKVELKKS